MKLSIPLLCLSLMVFSAAAEETKKPAAKAPNPSLAPIEDVAGLPRVLLIGDSISIGYTLPVRERLKGKANLHRIPTNGGPTSRGMESIDQWLGEGRWDVIHFNWGIHDLKYMPNGKRQVEPADYEANLRALIAKMKATGAKLIWATTTPIPQPPLIPDRKFGDEAEYNAIAAQVMRENAIPVNDLHAWVTPRFAELQVPKDLHYKAEGSAFLGEKVAAEIEKVIGKK